MNVSPQAQKIFEDALALSLEERQKFLDITCANDSVLLEEVNSLLSASNQAEDFFKQFSQNLNRIGAQQVDFNQPLLEKIGPWQLLYLLGKGGMGAVYLAERIDGEYDHRVALKLLPKESGDAISRYRFLSERQILAKLNHDNIARFLDGGVTDDGSPYFVMDYVDGIPINAYCEINNLTIKQRLRLLLKVCDAVSYAHKNLVIHRDLKPSNVLVDTNGNCKLLDFGIAKNLDSSDSTSELTKVAFRPLTRNYASPEMLRGQDVNVTADIYSLGIMLYELLTNQLPYQKLNSDLDLEKAISENKITKPSTLLKNDIGSKAFEEELDIITLKALKANPGERYSSVEKLIDDLNNYLNNKPISAKKDSLSYRIHKTVHRHKLTSTLSFLLFIAIFMGVSTSFVQTQKALNERDNAKEIKLFLASVFQNTNPNNVGGSVKSASQLLSEAAEKIFVDFKDRPVVQVELLSIVVDSLISHQEIESAEIYAKSAVNIANNRLNKDDKLAIQSRFNLANIYRLKGQLDDLYQLIINDIPLLRENQDFSTELVVSLSFLSHWAIDSGDFEKAENFAKEAVATVEKYNLPPSHVSIGAAHALAIAYEKLGLNEKSNSQSKVVLEKSIALCGVDPHPEVMDARQSYAMSIGNSGNSAEAVRLIQQNIQELSEFFGQNSFRIGFASQQIVRYQLYEYQISDARKNSNIGMDILGKISEPNSIVYTSALLARAYANFSARNFDLAETDFNQSFVNLVELRGETHSSTKLVAIMISICKSYLGKNSESSSFLKGLIENKEDDNSNVKVTGQFALGVNLRLKNDAQTANIFLEDSLASVRSLDTKTTIRFLEPILIELGNNSLALGNDELAEVYFSEAIEKLAIRSNPNNPLNSDAQAGLGKIFLKRGELNKAKEYLLQAQAYWLSPEANLTVSNRRWLGEIVFWLANTDTAIGNSREAGAFYAQAKALLEDSSYPGDAELLAKIPH